MSWSTVIDLIKSELMSNAKPERAVFEKGYLKSELEFLGATVPAVRKCAKRFAKEYQDLSRKDLRAFVDEMWATHIHEVRSVAVALLDHFSSLLRPSDLAMVRKRIIDAAGWAHVDWLAANVSGSIVLDHPECIDKLDEWAMDRSFWVRRAAMLSLLQPLRLGDLSEWPRFVRYAESMVEEKEFFIRKSIGWVLRETSKRNPAPVGEFLLRNKEKCSGLTLREGAKFLEPSVRLKLGLAKT
ncbi:MAG: DNA alkylation repair protein [Armatimonadetes bacterium]|nr:DNA alkylation repair protein [Armatimonadota bacterium]